MASGIEILQKPTATVGQIVKDLELTVTKRPNLLLGYCDDNFNDMYVKGVKLQKDIAILETTSKRNRAATADVLLSELRTLDASTGVVLQDGWRLLDIEPVNSIFKRTGASKKELESPSTVVKKGDTIFWFSENTNYSLLLPGRKLGMLETETK
jgi:hypothetical protein